ncbi:MAG: hypothetical protein V4650_16275 [Pseudomonadota bacterium]
MKVDAEPAAPARSQRPLLTYEELPATLSPVLRRLYAGRGLKPQQLDLDLKNLLPPQGLKGIAEASRLLADAIAARRRIVIAGDYDCDGATGVAVAILGLSALGATQVGYVVPDRVNTSSVTICGHGRNSP